MIKNKIFRIMVVLSITLFLSCSSKESGSAQGPSLKNNIVSYKPTQFPFQPGERITYAIRNLGLKVGDATLSFQGLTKLNNRDVFLIIFKANAMNFLDEEKIYADPDTFYPILVQRDLNIWGKKEKINEYYERDKGIIRIVKHVGDQTEEQIIEKKGQIDNIYCFIYRYRRSGDFQIGDSFDILLPTKDITIKLTEEKKIKAAGKVFKSYHMESDPKKYQIWFDVGEQKIPLRINGSIGLSATAMIMTDYVESNMGGTE